MFQALGSLDEEERKGTYTYDIRSGLRKGKGSPKALTQLDARASSNTRFGHMILHMKWRETKQYPLRIRPGHITQLFLIFPPFHVGHSVARLSMFCGFFPTCSAIAK